jgi:hypothetical protein
VAFDSHCLYELFVHSTRIVHGSVMGIPSDKKEIVDSKSITGFDINAEGQ